MKKSIILTILLSFISLFSFGKGNAFYMYKSRAWESPNKFNIGYSYCSGNLNEIWFGGAGLEGSFYFNMKKTPLEDCLAPCGPCVWYNQELSDFRGIKIGYQIRSYISCGVTVSWKGKTGFYKNGYCSLHHENHEWITGSLDCGEDVGVGLYVKGTLPLRYVSPFIEGQVVTNGNHTFGIGIMINLGGNIKKSENKHKNYESRFNPDRHYEKVKIYTEDGDSLTYFINQYNKLNNN